MMDMGGQPTVGGATTRQVIMVYIRKGDEQVMRSKLGISSVLQASVPASRLPLEFLV